ncbi:pectinesterase inhibitor 6-like [Cucurbita moschata]|uniref:Pectinesterase inhibitor 6-like n=1 Tax=Cucurbita moschata TaxID=3662 RepID=A0A6J1GQH3_CUCMO|nr:pectinesterase inhibitor 6-like [Cucurbita moschata]
MLRAPSSRASIAIIFALISILPWPTHSAKMSYVQEACSVTQHQDLCIQSLSPFSSSAKRSPTKWAQAGVSVTISEAKTVARFLGRVKNGKRLMGRNRAAVSDCVEVCEAAIAELHRSLGVLRRLGKRNLDAQMGDLTTWVSAALTNEDTCVDGFRGKSGKVVNLIRTGVVKAGYITSNALALISKLAASGFRTAPKQ